MILHPKGFHTRAGVAGDVFRRCSWTLVDTCSSKRLARLDPIKNIDDEVTLCNVLGIMESLQSYTRTYGSEWAATWREHSVWNLRMQAIRGNPNSMRYVCDRNNEFRQFRALAADLGMPIKCGSES